MQKSSVTEHEPFCDLVISILAVNSYPIEKAFSLLPALARQGLSHPEKLSALSAEDIYQRLVDSGYDRGEYVTYLLAERLFSLGNLVAVEGINKLTEALSDNSLDKIASFLSPVKGVGPVVLKNYANLRSLVSLSA